MEEDSFYKESLNNLHLPIFWKNLNSVFIDCNQSFANEAGLTIDKIKGKTDFELPWKKFAKKYIEDDLYVVENQKSMSFEENHINSEGIKKSVLVIKSPLFNKSSKVYGVMGVFIDITKEKELEKAKIKQKELEKLSHYTRLAAGTIAHDLRTPLASIQAGMEGIDRYLPLLIDAYIKAKEAGVEVTRIRPDILKNLKGASQRCYDEISFSHHYINLILGNLNSDEIDTESYTVHFISPLVQQAIDSYPFKTDEPSFVHVDLSQDFQFLGNATYLKNMINNLLKNALYYIADAQKGEIFIETQVNPETGNNALVFKDTAKGASPQIIQNMFKGFYSKRKGGTGLGLAFCKNVMQSFGGDIEARSVEGEYMEFVLTFPKLA